MIHLSVSDTLKKLQAQGMTQAEIHRATGIPKHTISRYTHGLGTKGADYGMRIARLKIKKSA